MSEKYNIPEENSLDSIEGIELENEAKDGKNAEEIISLEQIQKVMDMVVDIKTSGFAYHSINGIRFEVAEDFDVALEGLSKILKLGLLGTRVDAKTGTDDYIKKNFIDSIKKTPEKTRVYANIIGRDVWPEKEIQECYKNGRDTGDIATFWRRPVSLLFDVSDREEVIPGLYSDSRTDSSPDTSKSKGIKLKQMWAKLYSLEPVHMVSKYYCEREGSSFLSYEEVLMLFNLNILRYGNNINFEYFKKQIYSHEHELRENIDFEKLKRKRKMTRQ